MTTYFSCTETALTNSFRTAGEGMKIQMPHSSLLLVKLQPGLFSGFGLLSYTNLEPGGNETTWLSSSGTVLPHRLPAGILPGHDTVITAFSHWSGNWWSQKKRLINDKQRLWAPGSIQQWGKEQLQRGRGGSSSTTEGICWQWTWAEIGRCRSSSFCLSTSSSPS